MRMVHYESSPVDICVLCTYRATHAASTKKIKSGNSSDLMCPVRSQAAEARHQILKLLQFTQTLPLR